MPRRCRYESRNKVDAGVSCEVKKYVIVSNEGRLGRRPEPLLRTDPARHGLSCQAHPSSCPPSTEQLSTNHSHGAVCGRITVALGRSGSPNSLGTLARSRAPGRPVTSFGFRSPPTRDPLHAAPDLGG